MRRRSLANRFAVRFSVETIAVVLDADVASAYDSAEALNSFLRSAIAAIPRPESQK